MGVLILFLKSNFLGLLKCLNKLNWIIVLFSLINLSVCIYEDQIGKFDWRQSYVGKIKFAQFDTVSTAKKLIVATEENVLAALNLKTGEIVWRHVFESTSTGNIQLLHVADKVVTVTGDNPYQVRGWDSSTGVLLWEWSLLLQHDEWAEVSEFWVQQSSLVHMVPVVGSHIEVSVYNLWSGANRGATSKLPAQWVNDGCIVSAPYLTCVSGRGDAQLLISLDVTSQAVSVLSKPVSEFLQPEGEVTLRPLDGNSVLPGFLLDDHKIILLKDNKFEVVGVEVGDPVASVAIVDGASGPVLLQTWTDQTHGLTLSAHSAATGEELPELQGAPRELRPPEPEIAAALCARACRLLLTAADHAAHLLHQGGGVAWSREEALAGVAAAEFLDLPVSHRDAAIQPEFDLAEGSVWAAFSWRVRAQLQQLQAAAQGWLRAEPAPEHAPPLVRDYFNLHKVILLVTRAGKLFGVDNLSGEILWRRYEAGLVAERAAVLTQRSARHAPLGAQVTLCARHASGRALLLTLDPATGARAGAPRRLLPARPLQCALLPRADAQRLRPVLLLDENEDVHVFPESSAALVENMFMYVADRDTAKVQGYALRYDGQRVVAEKTWSVYVGGAGGAGGAGPRVAALAGKPAWERVRSAGTVLGDRSVLYKYSNPNLLLFVVDVPDPVHKDTVVATCVDGVSGAVVASAQHRRARAAPLAVHTDHALAYLYYSDKHRRNEIATLELYEGKERWLAAGAAFSSLAGHRAPGVQRAAYILPGAPTAAAVTHTERELTDKHVLVALSSGAILELPWQFLEPRRPMSPSAVDREEGLIPYAPELPVHSDAIINYNQSVHRVRAIYTAPSGLESTSLVLCAGLDLFYTRVAPSKTYDLLKEDFDYYLITIVLAALLVATYSTKYFASRKMLKMAWK